MAYVEGSQTIQAGVYSVDDRAVTEITQLHFYQTLRP